MNLASTNSHPQCVLAIDLGSGGPKAILYSADGRLLASASRKVDTYLTADGGGEQDANQWWRAVCEAAREVTAAGVVPRESIVAIACATQWSVIVPVDQAGEPLHNAIHWTDSRGARHTKRVMDGPIKVSGYGVRQLIRWLRMTGGVPTHSGADSLAHVLFLKHERPDVYRAAYKLLEPMDFINFRLTGRCAASYSTAFPYLLTDNRNARRIDYDPVLLAWSGVEREKLPDLLPVDTVLGPVKPEMAELWGVPRETPVVIGIGDTQAALVGSGAVAEYAGHVCVGTTSWMSCHVPFKKTHIGNFIATMPAALPGRNMVMAEQGAAGKCLETFLDQWLLADDALSHAPRPADAWERLEQLVSSVAPGSDGLIFLPWLNGAGPPSGDADMRGGFWNQSLLHHRGHAARAVMEGVTYNLRWVRDAIGRFTGRPFAELNFIGGGARSPTWCQTLANVLNVPVRQMADPTYALARGAALTALAALGKLPLEEIPRVVKVRATFEPQAEHRATYDELFKAFLAAYKANRPLFRRLNRSPLRRPAIADPPA
jgi:xylulokinase